MGRSSSSDVMLVPRPLVFAPLAVSFLALQRQLWSWDLGEPDGFPRWLREVVDWGGMGFPHSMIYPLAALQVPAAVIFLTVLLADVAVIWGVIRVLSARLRVTTAVSLWGAWILLSALAVLLTPVLLGWIWT